MWGRFQQLSCSFRTKRHRGELRCGFCHESRCRAILSSEGRSCGSVGGTLPAVDYFVLETDREALTPPLPQRPSWSTDVASPCFPDVPSPTERSGLGSARILSLSVAQEARPYAKGARLPDPVPPGPWEPFPARFLCFERGLPGTHCSATSPCLSLAGARVHLGAAGPP